MPATPSTSTDSWRPISNGTTASSRPSSGSRAPRWPTCGGGSTRSRACWAGSSSSMPPGGPGSRPPAGRIGLARRGTPVVAPVSGSVRRHDNRLGGISFYLNGRDGIEYYGAHLSAFAGRSGSVTQGTVIGYVGNTGDARGGPTHLHFEMHPGG